MDQILRERLKSHLLHEIAIEKPEEIVSHYGCMQAQDIPQSMWTVGSRLKGATLGSIRRSLIEGKIIRSWPMRGTIHLTDPKHLKWLLDLCASKTLSGFSRRRQFLGISDSYAEKALSIIELSLRGGKILTRKAFGEILKESGIPMQTQWTYHLACYAATRGLICFGPPTEKEETFVLLDEWVPKTSPLTKDEQLHELAKMYVRGHGPATIDDLAWWSGLGKTECKISMSMLETECKTLLYEGKIHYYYENDGTDADNGIRLLGGFDEYFIGYKDRSSIADLEHHGRLLTKNGILFPILIKGGKVIGTWKRTFGKDSVSMIIDALPGIKIDKNELKTDCRRYSDFYQLKDFEITVRN